MKGKQMLLFTLLLLTCLYSKNTYGQGDGILLKGKVTGKDAQPLAGVTVSVKGKPAEITQTDGDGNFSLRTKEFSGILVLSSIGYANKEVAFNPALVSFDVKMEESVSVLNEVVLTGYIKQKKSDITGAISSVRNKEFKDQPVSNLAQSMQGKVSGVLVSQPSGTPGAGLLVSIRGT
ncbi:MAG: carboxypeptidase-like regulatory domain-containing protein, partial [Panacibacter sp.]